MKMYRRIAFASIALNIALVVSLFAFLSLFMNVAKNLKIEMPMAIMWLINILHFVTNPQSIVPTIAILIAGFFALKAFGKRTQKVV